jgi:hypothetical protein
MSSFDESATGGATSEPGTNNGDDMAAGRDQERPAGTAPPTGMEVLAPGSSYEVIRGARTADEAARLRDALFSSLDELYDDLRLVEMDALS